MGGDLAAQTYKKKFPAVHLNMKELIGEMRANLYLFF